MGSKERQLSYSSAFKIEVVNYTKTCKPGSWKAFWLTSNREDTRMEEAKETRGSSFLKIVQTRSGFTQTPVEWV